MLNSINLKVENGEFISFLGASGSGKSTMLKTIAEIINQSDGSILLGGNIADKIHAYKRRTVVVFQDFRLFPHMTVLENISFPLKVLGVSKSECRKKSLELLKKVKLEGYKNRHVDKMSGGQMQRVALARALPAKPVVLLLDEPFSSLDINLRKEMRELVLKLQSEYKITTVLVTHDQEEALTMSDRIAFMHNGQIEQYDTPENIFKNPANIIVADYFSEGIYIDGEIINKKFVSEFIVVDKVFQGDNYLLKLNNTNNSNLKIQSIVSEPTDIIEGDRVNIKLDKNKLIYIPVK